MGQFIDQDGFLADHEDREPRPRAAHWCSVCHGHTGPGSPCAEDEPEEEVEDDSPYCGGCNPEPTIEEMDSGVCASCGKELA
jgi:hypothetical protein